MFRWACFGLAVIAVLGLFWLVNGLRVELQQTAQTVNRNLPEILDKTKTSTETLAALAEDIKQLRDLAGVASQARDKTLVGYADSVLDFIEASRGQIGLSKKLFGSGLKGVQPAPQWVVSARKEALWLVFRAKSRSEFATRLCENRFGSKWYIKWDDEEPISLLDWLRQQHPETKAIDFDGLSAQSN